MISKKSIVLLLFAVGLASAGSIGPDLKNLCGRGKLSLKTVADLAALAEQAESDSAGCPPIVIEALKAMKKITDDKKACTMDKALAITNFVDNYLKEKADAIPKALADFAVAYGTKVSSICTNQMVSDFVKVTEARIHNSEDRKIHEDFANFKTFLTDQSHIGTLLGAIAKTGEVVLPVDLLQMLPERAKFLFKVSYSDLPKDLVSVCERVLQPLYEPTLLPIAHLVRNGFISRPSVEDTRLKEESHVWTTALFFCESLKATEAGMQRGQSEEGVENNSRPSIGQSAQKAPVQPFESDAEVDGEIVTSPVEPLDASKSGSKRLSERIAGRSLEMMRAMVQSPKIRSLISNNF